MICSGDTHYNDFPPNSFQFAELCKMSKNRHSDNFHNPEYKLTDEDREIGRKHIKIIKDLINKQRNICG